MSRGKQQVLYNYLPGRTFDFEKVAVIARVDTIRGTAVNDLNMSMVLLKVAEQARAWQSALRPVLRDDVLRDPSRFVLVDPEEVRSSLFPNVFWCQNPVSCWIGQGAAFLRAIDVPSADRAKSFRFAGSECIAAAPSRP
jgi:hypothetical protein